MRKGIVSVILAGLIGSVSGASATGVQLNKKVKVQQTLAQKHLLIMQMFNQWLMVKQEGKSIVKYFDENNYKTIAIYGMSYLGERLLDELKDSGIEVKYAIDKNAENIYSEIKVRDLKDSLPEVDAIIVTAVYNYDEIEEDLAGLVNYPVISLEDVLYGV